MSRDAAGVRVLDPTIRTQFGQSKDASAVRIQEAAQRFSARDLDAAQRSAIDQFTTSWSAYTEILTQAQQMIAAGKVAEGQALLGQKASPKAEEAVKYLVTLADVSRTTAQARLADANDARDQARILVGLVLAGGLLLAIVVSMLNAAASGADRINGGIGEVVHAADNTMHGAQATRSAAAELTSMSEELRAIVGGFRH